MVWGCRYSKEFLVYYFVCNLVFYIFLKIFFKIKYSLKINSLESDYDFLI